MAPDLEFLSRIIIEQFDGRRHDREAFDCGTDRLNNFLKITASKYVADDNGQIYVAVDQGSGKLVGYHAIGPHALDVSGFDEKARKRFPRGWDRIPAFYLSMIATDSSVQGKGLGALLIGDVFDRCIAAGEIVGGRFIVLDALNAKAVRLYARMGFGGLASQPERMIISMAKVRRSAEEEARRATR